MHDLFTAPYLVAGAWVMAVLLARLTCRVGTRRPEYLDDRTRARLLHAVTRAYYDGLER